MKQKNRQYAHKDIDHIFNNLLPETGMKIRAAQIELCHTMLDALADRKIALCDAGVGIGKTHAYLVASVLYRKYETEIDNSLPILISTASIALQNAISNEYIPQLSDILINADIIDYSLQSAIRKGKKHYACDKRLIRRLSSVDLAKKNPADKDALLSLKCNLDLDEAEHLSDFDKRMVCVPDSCDCKHRECRYSQFVAECNASKNVFQICNHNYLIADAIHRHECRPPLLPRYCAVIIDEAHKLTDAAHQMFSRSLSWREMLSLITGIKAEKFILAYQKLEDALNPLVQGLQQLEESEANQSFIKSRKSLFSKAIKTLESIGRVLGHDLSPALRAELANALEVCTILRDRDSNYILFVEPNEDGDMALNAAAADYTGQMRNILWSIWQPIILTSGTLAIGGDFSSYTGEVGINGLKRTILEAAFPSPFDYEKNCLLYFPESMRHTPTANENAYYAEIADLLAELLRITNGHALVLFNSYTAMAAIYENMKRQNLDIPVFVMKNNQPHTLLKFRESGNGVLFATGAAWEGMDFPGDIVSSLIVVRLPFAVPNPFTDRKKSKYPDLRTFIRKVILPDMQMKLKQGFGRAIRTETDTCVISILDERSIPGKRYHKDVLFALPDTPVTTDKLCVETFICRVKPARFFAGGGNND